MGRSEQPSYVHTSTSVSTHVSTLWIVRALIIDRCPTRAEGFGALGAIGPRADGAGAAVTVPLGFADLGGQGFDAVRHSQRVVPGPRGVRGRFGAGGHLIGFPLRFYGGSGCAVEFFVVPAHLVFAVVAYQDRLTERDALRELMGTGVDRGGGLLPAFGFGFESVDPVGLPGDLVGLDFGCGAVGVVNRHGDVVAGCL